MSETLPWDHNQPLSISQLLKQSMRSVDTLVSNTSLLDKMAVHLNGLLRNQETPQVEQAVQLFDTMFSNATKSLETENDKQVMSVLKRQITSFIGITLGVRAFLDQHQEQALEDDEKNQLSCADAYEKEEAWHNDFYAPERAEHERLRQQLLDEEQYGRENQHGEEEERDEEEAEGEDDDEDEYEEVVEKVAVKSREIGGAGGFVEVRRKQKKKKQTITTNFTYSHNNSYDNYQNCGGNNYNNRPPPRHQPVRVSEFRPQLLEELPHGTFCIPVFFPSEDSYCVFHSALSTAQETLYVCVFSLTDNDTANVLIDAKKRGVDVKIITDNDQMDASKGADCIRLNEQYGIPYKKDNSDQFMHNKFAVMDGKTVITGSFNWSAGARFKNRENIIVTNIPSVVDKYSQEFEKLWRYF